MTKDEIIEMAKQAGFLTNELKSYVISPYTFEDQDLYEEIEAFAKLVALRYQKKIADLENIICQRHWDVLQEREACAKIADEWAVGWPHPSTVIAERIRARS
jgi:hypothetical protein